MTKPVLLTVDDDAEVLRAIERDLRRKYAGEYRVLRAESGTAAMEIVRELKLRNNAVALFLVDQRMPGLSGVEFLEQAIELFPDAKRVLLTAYADTDAAIAAINEAGVNHYLLKPWDPPEENLYPGARRSAGRLGGDVSTSVRRHSRAGQSLVSGVAQHQRFSRAQSRSLSVARHRDRGNGY